jgi:fluoride exporter
MCQGIVVSGKNTRRPCGASVTILIKEVLLSPAREQAPRRAGGAVGAVLREFAMLTVPNLTHGFPLDILVANLLAASMLGFVTALHNRRAVSDAVNSLIGTGFTGGPSTFSSFAYGSTVLATASTQGALVAFAYVVTSLVMGYIAVIVGMKLGAWGPTQSGGDRIDLCLA